MALTNTRSDAEQFSTGSRSGQTCTHTNKYEKSGILALHGTSGDGVCSADMELLMVGSCSSTYRLGQVVIKVPRIDEEAEITQANVKATTVEANVYRILGAHDRIAHCLYISPLRDMITLEFYNNGNLKDYVATHGPTQLRKWAKQMIEAVEFIHERGVRHSDLRLDQWLLDSGVNARLSDFNASGYDECPTYGLRGEKALGLEDPSHFMPRDPSEDNSVRSDLFALGSALYEIEHGSAPFAGADEQTITEHFARREFPSVSHLTLGHIISRSWEGKVDSATKMLQMGRQIWDFEFMVGPIDRKQQQRLQ